MKKIKLILFEEPDKELHEDYLESLKSIDAEAIREIVVDTQRTADQIVLFGFSDEECAKIQKTYQTYDVEMGQEGGE